MTKLTRLGIIGAIRSNTLVAFRYDGHNRVVIPAAYGLHVSTGNEILRGYQVRGSGNTRPVPFWDLFLTHKMTGFKALDEPFLELPPHYARGDKHISPLFAQL